MTICPKCGTRMIQTHAMQAGPVSMTHRAVCADKKCGCIATLVTFVAVVDPKQGQGYVSVANKINAGEVSVATSPIASKKRGFNTSQVTQIGSVTVETRDRAS